MFVWIQSERLNWLQTCPAGLSLRGSDLLSNKSARARRGRLRLCRDPSGQGYRLASDIIITAWACFSLLLLSSIWTCHLFGANVTSESMCLYYWFRCSRIITWETLFFQVFHLSSVITWLVTRWTCRIYAENPRYEIGEDLLKYLYLLISLTKISEKVNGWYNLKHISVKLLYTEINSSENICLFSVFISKIRLCYWITIILMSIKSIKLIFNIT